MEGSSSKIKIISNNCKSESTIQTPLKNGNPSIQYGGVQKQEDDVPILPSASSSCRKFENCLLFLSSLTIEPVIFCIMFAFIMNMSSLANLFMDKGCLYRLNISSEICSNISYYPEEKKEVEILANNFAVYANLMSLLGAFFMIFIAPWSDKYGRKFPLLMAVAGSILTDVGLLMCIIYFDSGLEYIILSKVPAEMSGGFICILTIVFSHASEVSTEKTRTLKYTTIELFFGLGLSLGMLTAGWVYRYFGYAYIYIISACLHVFCLPWVFFFVQETRGQGVTLTWSEKAQDFFVCESFKNSIKSTFRPRADKQRALIVLYLLSMTMVIICYESLGSIGFIYLHHIYDWDMTKYNTVSTVFSFCQMIFIIIFVPVMMKVYKISDSALGLIGTISMIAKNALYAFAKYQVYIYYLGSIAGFLSSLCTLTIRAGISKLVDKDELGRVFSFLATCEAVVPMLGTMLVTKVFNATIDVFPSVSYLMTVGLLLLPLGTFIWAYIRSRRQFAAPPSPYVKINEKI